MVDAPTNLTIRQKGGPPQPRPRPPRPLPQQGREMTIFLEGTGAMRVACGGSLSLPLVLSDSTRRNISGRNTTKALQKGFRRLEEIYDQKRHKSLPSVGNFNCLVICSIHFHLNSIATKIFHNPLNFCLWTEIRTFHYGAHHEIFLKRDIARWWPLRSTLRVHFLQTRDPKTCDSLITPYSID